MRLKGLSPRVRGNLYRETSQYGRFGSIPACAGEPKLSLLAYGPPAVYPRVCGGTNQMPGGTMPAKGLSPRVRGNHLPASRPRRFARSIPACAGEPMLSAAAAGTKRVYPRVCGGTPAQGVFPGLHQGLSPRVRGNLVVAPVWRHYLRSIPACAGEPPTALPTAVSCAVYPRVCGGTSHVRLSVDPVFGLSPRVRGNRQAGDAPVHNIRSIPACAGEPASHTLSPLTARVYPRVCGGTQFSRGNTMRKMGLSPRVRGNLTGFHVPSVHSRSIPACAGEPRSASPAAPASTVYPRVCGGTQLVRATRAQI